MPKIVDRFTIPAQPRLFADVEEEINTELTVLDRAMSQSGRDAGGNLAPVGGRSFIHRGTAEEVHFRRIEADEIIGRRIRSAFAALLPNGYLQERTLNVTSFLDRFGPSFIDLVYDSIDLDDKGHRIVYI